MTSFHTPVSGFQISALVTYPPLPLFSREPPVTMTLPSGITVEVGQCRAYFIGWVAATTGVAVPPLMSTVRPARAPAGPPPLDQVPPPTWRILPGRYIVAVDVAPTGLPRLPWLPVPAPRVPRIWIEPSPAGSSSNICVPEMLKMLPLVGATKARGYHQRFSSGPPLKPSP